MAYEVDDKKKKKTDDAPVSRAQSHREATNEERQAAIADDEVTKAEIEKQNAAVRSHNESINATEGVTTPTSVGTTETPSANPVGGNQPTASGNQTQQGGNQGGLFTLDDLGMDGKLPATTSTTDNISVSSEDEFSEEDYALASKAEPKQEGPKLKRTFRDLFLQQNPNTELTEEQLKKKARLEKAQKAISALGEIGTGIANIIGARKGANALDTKSNVTLSEAARKRWEDWRKNYEERLAKYRAGMQQATKDDYAQLNKETDQQYRQRSLSTHEQNSFLNGIKWQEGAAKRTADKNRAEYAAKREKLKYDHEQGNVDAGHAPDYDPDKQHTTSAATTQAEKAAKAQREATDRKWLAEHYTDRQLKRLYENYKTSNPTELRQYIDGRNKNS